MKTKSLFAAVAICAMLAACGAKTEEQADAQPDAKPDSSQSSDEKNTLTTEQMDELRKTRTVEVVFKPAGGSSGNGEVMKELKAFNGVLSDPVQNYDVYTPESTLSAKELKQEIEVSLDKNRRVLIDNNGTPESRAKATELLHSIVGGSIPDIAGVILMKAPEEKGGGYLTIPLYNGNDVQNQIAQGRIPNAGEQPNSIENFFFEPKNPQ